MPGWLHLMAKVALMDEHWKRYWLDKLKGRKYGKIFILDRTDTPIGKCELCRAKEELRPFGPKGEWVCFDCGMKDEAAMKRGLDKLNSLREQRKKAKH